MRNFESNEPPKDLDELLSGPDRPEMIFCSQCGETYPATELGWEYGSNRPTCRNFPSCDGMGLGDLWDGNSPYLGGPVE